MSAGATRRGLLRGAPAAVLAPAAAAGSAGPDGELIAACARVIARERRFIALHDEVEDDAVRDPLATAILREGRADMSFVIATPARTLDGVRAKLAAALIEDQEWLVEAREAVADPQALGNRLQGSLLLDAIQWLKPDIEMDAEGRPR